MPEIDILFSWEEEEEEDDDDEDEAAVDLREADFFLDPIRICSLASHLPTPISRAQILDI